MKSILFVFLLALSFMVGCVTTEKQRLEERGLIPMSAEEFQNEIIGKNMHGKTAKGVGFKAKYNADGTYNVSWEGGGSPGKWTFRDAKLCSTLKIRKNKEKCVTYYKTGDSEYTIVLPDGSLDGVMWAVK